MMIGKKTNHSSTYPVKNGFRQVTMISPRKDAGRSSPGGQVTARRFNPEPTMFCRRWTKQRRPDADEPREATMS